MIDLASRKRSPPTVLRWRDFDEQSRSLTVREAVYEGVFSTPKAA